MSTPKIIMVAIGLRGSEDNELIEYALEYSQTFSAKLILVHIVEPISDYGTPYASSKIENIEHQLEDTATLKLKELANQYQIPSDQQIIARGKAKTVVAELAEEFECDLVIVGAPFRNEIELLLMGSTAAAILQSAPCHVLAVRIHESAKRISE